MDKYETVRDIIVGEIDCIGEREACGRLLESHGWPTYALFTNGTGSYVHPANGSLDGFIEKAEEIHSSIPGRPLSRSFKSEFNDRFPAFVFTDPNASACSLVFDLEDRVQTARGQIYFDVGTKRSYRVYLPGNRSVDYKGAFDLESLSFFTSDWSLPPLGNWPLTDGVKSSRRLAVYVVQNDDTAQKFLDLAQEFLDRLILGKRLLSDFRASYPGFRISSQSLIVFSQSKKRFRVFGNIEKVEDMSRLLHDFVTGTADRKMKFDASILIPANARLNPRQRSRLLRGQFLIPVFAGPIILVILFKTVHKRIQKLE
jgi:hypothetical protein